MNQKNFWKSKLFLVLVVLTLFTFLVIQNPVGLLSPVQSLGQTILSPVQHMGTALGYTVHSLTGFFEGVTHIKNENRELQKKNLELQAKNAALEQLSTENKELRRNLNLLPKNEYEFIAASIIAKDPSGLQNFITLDKGSNDGISVGMPAVVETGVLVGKVTEVFNNSASVTLVTQHASIVNVETSTTAIRGVARGEHGNNIILDMVEQGKEIKEGDAVVTSGLGGVYPRGLLLGTLSNIGFTDDKLFQRATIVSPVAISQLHFVFLIR